MPNGRIQQTPRNGGRTKITGNSVGTLVSYCKKYAPLILIAIFFAIISAILTVIGPDYISDLTETITQGISAAGVNIDMEKITHIGWKLIFIYAAGMILHYLQSFIMNYVSCNLGKGMRTGINEKISKIPLKYFDTHNYGDTLSRVTNDVDMISQSLNGALGMLVSSAATILGCVVMMFITEWRMALTAIASCLIGFLLMGLIMGKSQRYFHARQFHLAEVNSHIEEYYAGQNIVRAYNSEEKGIQDFRRSNEKLRKSTIRAEFLSGLMMPIMSFIGNFGYVAVCIVGAALAFQNSISFSVVVAFMLYIRLFTSPLGQIGQGVAQLQSALAASERVDEFMKEEELSDEGKKTKALTNIKGNVKFDHISFGYTPEKMIIHDFSAEIKAGQKVAIVGPTGAGKTTIVNLLMRFYELNKGHISIDGIPLDEVTRENVHDSFGMVLQDTWLFQGTIRENLTYGRGGVTDDKLLDICNQCGLKHFITTLPDGLDTVLDDNISISAGQKQLLTIARAMVEDAPMLILDEATSSVDTRTEGKIQKAMNTLTEGRTSFVIAHRLSTIKDADVIIYMKDGDIKETGTHEELMGKNGYYAELYNSQFMQVS